MLLQNPVIQGLLGGGPNAIRAQADQQRMALAPRAGGGMAGAPGPIVMQDRSMDSLGQGLAGLGQGLASIGQMREKVAQREAFEAAIATLPPEEQAMARLYPDAYVQAKARAMFAKPEKLTTSNTGLFDVDGKPKRMALEEGIKQGLPEWQDPPDMKTFGNDVVGYYGIKRNSDGTIQKVDLVPGLGRDPKAATTVETAEGVFVLKPDGTLGPRIGGAKSGAVKTIITADGVFTVNPDGSLGNKLGDAPFRPQDEYAAYKFAKEQKADKSQAVTSFEDIGNVIRQAEIILQHPGRTKGTGMSRALFAPFGVTLPGSDVAGFDAQLETLKAKVFLPEVQKMQGMGALSNAEGQKISAAFAALDPNMGDAEFEKTLRTAIGDLQRAQERAKGRLPDDYTPAPAAAPAESSEINILIDKYAGEE